MSSSSSSESSSSESSSPSSEEAYEFLRKTTKPISIHRNPGMTFADYDTTTSYSRGRAAQILSENHYKTIVPGKYLPSFDLIHYCEIIPYTVDLYALQYHPQSTKVITDELIVDIRRKKHEGLTIVPYEMSMTEEQHKHLGLLQSRQERAAERLTTTTKSTRRGKAFVEHANQYKKQMICSHYDIDPRRYIIIDEDKLFSKRYAMTKDEIEKILFTDRWRDTMSKSKDDLYVELMRA